MNLTRRREDAKIKAHLFFAPWRLFVRPLFHYLIAAAVFHLVFTLAVYMVGRFALLPGMFDAFGTGVFFATDSFVYRAETISMTGILTREGIGAWLATPAPFHVRAYSLSFAAFGPVLGFNILSAEPLNLLCYLCALMLIFKLGQEVFERRVGLVAAVTVALWPSLLLHTTQLLRDPLFIAATLALVFVSTTWLTRDYSRRGGFAVGIAGGMAACALWLIRINMWGVVPLIVLLGAVLFVIRLIYERRMMKGNLWGVVTALALTATIPVIVPRPVYYMTRPDGAPLVESHDLPAAALSETAPDAPPQGPPPSVWERPGARIGYARAGFKRQFPKAGSNIDPDAQFDGLADVLRYVPRALAIGLFAPFPDMWFAAGERVGVHGRLLSGIETVVIYIIEGLALVGLWHSRRRPAAWLLLLIALACVTALGLVVLNVAALYRMRYVFLMLLILLGAHGAVKIIAGSEGPGKVINRDGQDRQDKREPNSSAALSLSYPVYPVHPCLNPPSGFYLAWVLLGALNHEPHALLSAPMPDSIIHAWVRFTSNRIFQRSKVINRKCFAQSTVT